MKKLLITITLLLLLPIQAFAAVITDNFESYSAGDLNGQGSWSGDTNYDVQTSVVNTGSKAVQWAAAGSISKSFGAGVTDGSQVFYVRRTGDTGAGENHTYRLTEGGTRKIIVGYVQANGSVFSYYDGGTGYTSLGIAYNANTWYRVEVEWRSSDKKARFKIDSNAWSDWKTQIESFTTNISGFQVVADATSGQTFYLDDLQEPTAASDPCLYSGTGDYQVLYSSNCHLTTNVYVVGTCKFIRDAAGYFGIANGASLSCDRVELNTGFRIQKAAGARLYIR